MQSTESTPSVRVFDDPEQVAREAAGLFVRLSIEAVSERGSFSVALSGGTTPRRVYELLASDDYRTASTEWTHGAARIPTNRPNMPQNRRSPSFSRRKSACASRSD